MPVISACPSSAAIPAAPPELLYEVPLEAILGALRASSFSHASAVKGYAGVAPDANMTVISGFSEPLDPKHTSPAGGISVPSHDPAVSVSTATWENYQIYQGISYVLVLA